MNTTIRTISDNTMNLKVRDLALTILKNNGKLFKAVFTNKDGEVRTMIFTNATNWNPLNGIETTISGAKMVATKCLRNMATVIEKLADGTFQPRTLNLDRVISLELV